MSPAVGYYLTMENLSEMFGWTPEEIDRINIEDLMSYLAILKGKGEKSVGKQERRMLR